MGFNRVGSLRLVFPTVRWFIAFAFLLVTPLVHGQGKHRPLPPPVDSSANSPLSSNGPLPLSPLDQERIHVVTDDHGKAIATSEYACFLPPLNSVSAATVGVVDLQAPQKSKDEYQSGCHSLRQKQIADAEKHLRKAVANYERYAAAWVLLGQLLESQQKLEEANDACAKSLNASSSYLPGFLCLTDISTRQQHWLDALKFSGRALEIDPTGTPVSYALNATANLELHHLPEAEKSALKASEMDAKNNEPRVHYLLAQIYVAEGDRTRAVDQLHEYLKYAKDPADVAVAKNVLATLESQTQE